MLPDNQAGRPIVRGFAMSPSSLDFFFYIVNSILKVTWF